MVTNTTRDEIETNLGQVSAGSRSLLSQLPSTAGGWPGNYASMTPRRSRGRESASGERGVDYPVSELHPFSRERAEFEAVMNSEAVELGYLAASIRYLSTISHGAGVDRDDSVDEMAEIAQHVRGRRETTNV